MERPFFLKIGCKFVLFCTIAVALIITGVLAAVFAPYRLLVLFIARRWDKDICGFNTGISNAMARAKARTGESQINLGCFLVFDGSFSVEGFRKVALERLDNDQFQRFKENYRVFMGFSVWKKWRMFKLQEHIRDWDYNDLELPERWTAQDFNKIMDGFLRKPWKEGRSPWEWLLIRGFKPEAGKGTKLVLVARWDHALADGQSMITLFKRLCQVHEEAPSKPARAESLHHRVGKYFKMIYDLSSDLYEQSSALNHRWKYTKKSAKFYTAISAPIRVDVVKEIKNSFGVGFIVVLVAAISEALFAVHEKAGIPLAPILKFDFPVPKPNHPSTPSNHGYLCRLMVRPKKRHGPDDLVQIQEQVTALTTSLTMLALDTFVNLLNFIPTFIWAPFALYAKHDFFTMSVFPLGEVKLELLDCVVTDAWCALQTNTKYAALSAGALCLSMNGSQRITACIDKSLFPNENLFENFGFYVQESIQRLHRKATERKTNFGPLETGTKTWKEAPYFQ